MTDEQINAKFDVVADHLASIAVNVQKLEEAQLRSEKRVDRLERVLKLAIRAGLRERRETREKINALIAAQERAEDRQERADERQRLADERQERADERQRLAQARADEWQRLADERQAQADERQRLADERQAHTDARMNELAAAMAEMAKAVTKNSQRMDVIESNSKKKK